MKQNADRHRWKQSPAASTSTVQKSWLMRSGALTTGLRTLGKLELRVLAEYASGLSPDESASLGYPVKTAVWVREVVMRIDDVDCIVARSVTPLVASHGVWQGVRRLRSRPLADILYQDRSIKRSAFEVARINAAVPLMKTARKILKNNKNGVLPARRSVFWKDGYPLLVAECFLPAFWLKT